MKILYISYFYPPLGGPAALRNLKTVKYLSELGCSIDVLTVKDIEYSYHDESLEAETRERSIIRTASCDPMALLKKLFAAKPDASKALYNKTPERIKQIVRWLYPIDDKIGWLPNLIAAGSKALQQDNYDLIYVSCGPFSSSLAAWWLSRRYKVPYVVEMRDYWTLLSDYNLFGTAMQRGFARFWERRILRSATGIVSATRGIATDLANAFGAGLQAKSFVLYNGHDEEDYQDIVADKRTDNGFIFSYFGALYARRSLKNFYAAIKELAEAAALPVNTEIRLYGNYNLEAMQEIAASGLPCVTEPESAAMENSGKHPIIRLVSPLGHKEALMQMQSSDALLLVINSSSPGGTLTSKVFEYLRIGKPILAMVPARGEVADLLTESGQHYSCAMESTSGIKSCIIRLISERNTAYCYPAAKYNRKAQIADLYHFLCGLPGLSG